MTPAPSCATMVSVLIAMTRPVPPTIIHCQLTHLEREPIDVTRAEVEHAAYEAALRTAGCHVITVEAAPEMPDSVFIEDSAVVLDEIAIITRPGAESRRGETAAVAKALQPMRPLVQIDEPATLDGGDVLRVGKKLFVGRSTRTNAEAIQQLRAIVEPLEYSVVEVEVAGALHLKSAVTAIDAQTLIAYGEAVDLTPFARFDIVEVDEDEAAAANVLRIRDQILVAASALRTMARLRGRGLTVVPVEQRELAKAEAGLTCCSLIFET